MRRLSSALTDDTLFSSNAELNSCEGLAEEFMLLGGDGARDFDGFGGSNTLEGVADIIDSVACSRVALLELYGAAVVREIRIISCTQR